MVLACVDCLQPACRQQSSTDRFKKAADIRAVIAESLKEKGFAWFKSREVAEAMKVFGLQDLADKFGSSASLETEHLH